MEPTDVSPAKPVVYEEVIIVARYGLNGEVKQTLEQLGKERSITKERVRQLETRAQIKMERRARKNRLKDTSLE